MVLIMEKRNIVIEDDLKDKIDGIQKELIDHFMEWLKDNPDCNDFDEYSDDSVSDYIHECVDGWTPIYYNDIDGLYYLYGSEFETSYSDSGIGDGTEDNHKQVAIYCYLEAKAYDILREMTELFDNWVIEEPKRTVKELESELKDIEVGV